MKILIDMNLSPWWVPALASHGVEAVHWSDVGAVTAPDSEIMEYANAHGYAILTHDLDFSAMLAACRREKPSLIQLRTGDISPGSAVQVVVSAMRQAAEEIESGAVLTVELGKSRLRILPFS